MRFPQAIEVMSGQAFSTNVVLVVTPARLGASDRGTVFLSLDEGKTYKELYVGRYTGTRKTYTLTVVVPNGDEIYTVNCNRDGDMVAFATKKDGVTYSHLLTMQSHLPKSDYTIQELTPAHMSKIETLR